MYTENLVQKVFIEPLSAGGDRLCILSAHASPSMSSWLLKKYEEMKIPRVSIKLIIGMTPAEGISLAFHEGFKVLHKNNYAGRAYDFSCSYIYKQPSIPDNFYIWLRDGQPFCAFSGGAEFTQEALLRHPAHLHKCSVEDAFRIFCDADNRCVHCRYSEIEEDVAIFGSYPASCIKEKSGNGCRRIHLSLLTSRGIETGVHSGLNWGQRGKRNRNEAYIPLPSKIAKSGFFPLKKQHFIALTDDHCALLLRIEQQGNKAITTPASNAQLGEYFRNRLSLPNGAYVHRADLESYGRTDVDFYKIDDEQFYMDFSVNAPNS